MLTQSNLTEKQTYLLTADNKDDTKRHLSQDELLNLRYTVKIKKKDRILLKNQKCNM